MRVLDGKLHGSKTLINQVTPFNFIILFYFEVTNTPIIRVD